MNPTLKDQLKDWIRKQHATTPKKKRHKKPLKPKSERLTDSDIKNLMGINQRGLRRGKGGAWK